MASDQEFEETGVAVIGLAGRFPGAGDARAFWANLCEGVTSIVAYDEAQLDAAGVSAEERRAPTYAAFGAPLADVAGFDAAFFGFTPREAEVLDPQQRLFLQTCYHALEDAGQVIGRLPERVGVFAGSRFSDYLTRHLYPNRTVLDQVGPFQAMLSNDKDYLAPLVSYKLNLDGPSMAVQTACSTSLVAVHLAAEALLSHTCNLALAGGVSVRLPQEAGYHAPPGGIFSPTGRVRSFDAAADGTVFGNGVGVVVLKRLEDAVADRDRIYGLVLGSAVNNDGGRKVGLTAPSAEGQARVVADALAIADVEPEDVSFIECHGTGTHLGDAIEVAALAKVFGGGAPGSCALGAVKTNVGHLEAAAGMAGMIKLLYMLHHRRWVPSLHFETPNPQIGFEHTPFYVNTQTQPWPDDRPTVAGISSFGIGGTNAHLILGEAPERDPLPAHTGPQRLCLSARDGRALDRAAAELAAFLAADDAPDLRDVAATLRTRRQVFDERLSVAAHDAADAARALREGRVARGRRPAAAPAAVWLFPGQGAQYPGMARGAYEAAPEFRAWIDRGVAVLQPLLPVDARALLLAEADDAAAAAALQETQTAQPLLFLVGYALARQWLAWGLEPRAMLGHSIGEYVAAALAEVFSFEEGLALTSARGRFAAAQAPGSMLSVPLGAEHLTPFLNDDLHVAAVNAPELTVVGGPDAAVLALAERLRAAALDVRVLQTSHAFHGPAMDGAADALRGHLAGVALRPPKRPFISNVTGTWITDAQACDPDYWADQMRLPVQFCAGLKTLAAQGPVFWLELGPGRGAGAMARATVPGSPGAACLGDPRADAALQLLDAQGRLWLAGLDVGPAPEGDHVSLPGYPFAAEPFWVAAPRLDLQAQGPAPVAAVGAQALVPAVEEGMGNRPEHLADTYAAPVGAAEQALAAGWAEVLGVRPIGRHDDFFDLGGHSLSATRVLGRLREAGYVLTLQDFFDGAVLSRLAAAAVPADGVPGDGPAARPTGQAPGMTAAQERFWFLAQVHPDDPSYNLTGAFDPMHAVPAAVMEQALADLRARHEVLRTRFPDEGGRPRAEVVAGPVPPLTVVDLSGLPEAARAAAEARVRRQDAWRPFNLAAAPPWRALLLITEPQRRLCLLNLHHIIADGGSFAPLSRDLGTIMAARLRGHDAGLPALPVQYGDFALWQRARLDGPTLERLETYWCDRLGDAPLVFDAEPDFARPATLDPRGARVPVRLDAETTAGLHRLARTHNAGLFMVLTAAWQIVLAHRAGKTDFLLGTDVTHRNHPALEPLVGLFVNQVVLRAQLAGNPSLAQVLERVRTDALGAFAHQDLPFERLVELLRPERDLGRTPVFQVRFVFQNHAPVEAGGAAFSGARADEAEVATRHDLRLELHEDRGAVAGIIEYRTALFRADTAAGLARCLEETLRAMVAAPELPLVSHLRRLNHMPESTAHLLRAVMSGSPLQVTRHAPQLLTEAAAQMPERLALACDAEPGGMPDRYGYADLVAAAARVGGLLRAHGVRREDVVGVFVPRSATFVMASVGCWWAGAAFAPMDVQAPPAWLAFQLSRNCCRHILTLSCYLDRLPADLGAHVTVLCLDTVASAAPCALPTVLDHQAAYVLFTSGSTGTSKAVAVTHANLSHYTEGVGRALDAFGGHWAFIQSPVGDAWITGFCVPWRAGGAVHAISPEAVANPERYLAYCAVQPMDCLKIMPSIYQAMMAGGRFAELLPERLLVLGGEPAEVSWVQALSAAKPGLRIFNHYGITETTVGNVVRRLDGPFLDGCSAAPMGRPLPGVRAVVVDGLDRQVAPGMHGELHLAGPVISRGYMGRPALTAQRFVPDPFSPEPGGRRYATGDVVRADAAGELHFRGRADHQLKIRGFRVEPGEVENALRRTGKVAVSVVRLIRAPHPLLTAYVVPVRGTGVDGLAADLRAQLAAHLPAAMVPGAFVVLEAMPRLLNGKIDLRALPLPGEAVAAPPKRPPSSALERRLAAVWAQVLGREEVGADDNFFAVGGDSLLSIRAIALANRAGLPLTTEIFFAHQTLAEQAAWLARRDREAGTQLLVPLQPGGRRPPLYVLHAAGGMVYGYIELSRALGPDQPLVAVQDPAYMGLCPPLDRVEDLAERAAGAVRAHHRGGPLRLAGHSMGGLTALEVACRLRDAGQAVDLVVMADTRAPGRVDTDLADDPERVVLHHLAAVMYRGQGRQSPIDAAQLAPLGSEARLAAVSDALRRLPGCAEFTPERLAVVVAAYVAHVRAAARYTGRRYDGRVLLLRPSDEPSYIGPSGWAPWLPHLTEHTVPGDHTTMLTRPHVAALSEVLGRYFD